MHVTIKSTSGINELLNNIQEALVAIPEDTLLNYDYDLLRSVATYGISLKLTLQNLIDTANKLSSQRQGQHGVRITTLVNKQTPNKVKVTV